MKTPAPVPYRVDRHLELWATAVGYDIHVVKTGKACGGERIYRHYQNVTAATMRRFYRLSQSYIDINQPKDVTWKAYDRIFRLNVNSRSLIDRVRRVS